MEMPDMLVWLSGAALLRVALVLYGEWQDRTMAVKFTDVDYYVFNDAARFVTLGQSPYNRATFRYTPLLAWALTPNILLHSFFGKLLFILFDILSGHLIYSIVRHSGAADKMATICSLLWLLNPLPMVVSSRGNAESLMAFLVLQTLRLLQGKCTVLAALVFALAVHVKIYPVTYALGVYLYLGCQDEGENGTDGKVCTDTGWTKVSREKPNFGSSLAEGHRSGPLLGSRLGQRGVRSGSSSLKTFLWTLRPTWIRIKFGLVAGLTLVALTAVFYAKYGWVFLYETYLYHIVRKDIRHNFSPYFYMLYLTGEDETTVMTKFLTFLPQVLLLVGISLRYHCHLPLCFFLCTFSFVMLNKVCTSQYFLWYLCLLPLLVPRLRMGWKKTAVLTCLWFLAQGVWLLPAYYLEFEGQNTFLYIWLAGLFFFMVNVTIVCAIIMNYDYAKSCPALSKVE